MKWEEKELGKIITLKRGYDISKKEQIPGDYPVVSSSGIQSYHNDFKVNGAGVAIGRKGTLGTCYYIEEDFWAHSTVLYVKDFKGNHRRFIYYLLKTLGLERLDVGASNPTLNRNHAHKIIVRIPKDLETQKKIASILSAYDDLIENNLRRIRLLEEAAQHIYREWFVRFRFPGHEQVELVPEGWERMPYSEAAEYINGFAFKPKHHFQDGIPIIKIRELKNGITDDTPRHSGDGIKDKYKFGNGSILFSWSADLNVYWWANGEALLNQHLFIVHPENGINKYHFFFSLKNSMGDFRNRANGATMKHIKRSELENVFYLKPSERIVSEFEKIVSPILEQTINLTTQNQKLKEARDILLPRLMNQTIEV